MPFLTLPGTEKGGVEYRFYCVVSDFRVETNLGSMFGAIAKKSNDIPDSSLLLNYGNISRTVGFIRYLDNSIQLLIFAMFMTYRLSKFIVTFLHPIFVSIVINIFFHIPISCLLNNDPNLRAKF